MNNFQEKYKRRPGGFNDTTTGRLVRAGQHEERRRVNRAQHFFRHRDVSQSPVKQAPKPKNSSDPAARLRRWKAEKALKKKIEQLTKKPIFKVGVVHHRFYSPTANDKINSKTLPCHTRGAHRVKTQPSPPKRITRATQKRLEAKQAAAAATAVMGAAAAASHPSMSVTRTKSQKKQLPSAKKELSMSFAPINYAFKGPAGIKEIPMFGRFAINRESLASSSNLAEELENPEDKPWPTLHVINDASVSPQKMRNTLVRQIALDRSSFDGFVEEDSSPKKNSSLAKDLSLPEVSPVNVDDTMIHDTQADPKISNDSPMKNNVDPDTPPPRSNSPAPAIFSPYVTTSRGKDSARHERRSKIGIGRTPPDEIPTKDTIMQSLNISVEEEERTAQYFKFILQREIDRLNEICDKWESSKSEPDLTEDARYLINQAVGQTRLLVRKKFERFRRLVLDCETGKGEMLVQCRDLQGFWDMMYMEVKNCESRFQKLETLRSNDWIEDDVVTTMKKPTDVRKKISVAPKIAINAKSSARSWILERKKKMSQSRENDENDVFVENNVDDSTNQIPDDATISARRSSTESPRNIQQATTRTSLRGATKNTPVSLLKTVQLSEAGKNVRSPLAIMKISKMCKTPKVQLDDTISYVNSDQTPGKGILKKSDDSSKCDSAIAKSSRKVDFNNVNDVLPNEDGTIDENLENSIDLGRALARIDSYDNDEYDDVFEPCNIEAKNITIRRIEKRLDFEDESFNETENTDIAETSTVFAATPENFRPPIIEITVATPSINPLSVNRSISSTSTRSKRRTSNIAEMAKDENPVEENHSMTRVLRSRTISMSTPNKSNHRVTKLSPSEKKTIELEDSGSKENYDPEIASRIINETESNENVATKCDNDDHTKRRRSTRKSVRLNAEDCSACTNSIKPVHPMTPHTRRTRKISLLGDNSRQSIVPLSSGDLMSFDSPATIVVPSRVRRASEVTRKSSSQ